MKRVVLVVLLLVAAAVLGLWRSNGGVRAGLSRMVNVAGEDKSAGATSDETRKSFELKPGERINIQGINGFVEVQTSDTKTAEVFVRRSGDSASALQRRELIIEQNADGLLVRSKQAHVGLWGHLFGRDPKEEVTIKAPRQIALSIRGVNGRVFSGDIDGSLELKGVNGKVELGLVNNFAQVGGVNGSISFGLRRLDERGAKISGVNGGIELKLSSDLDADLTARGMNGSVRSEIPEVAVNRDEMSRHYSATIGNGGPSIEIAGVNGNVRLTRAAGASQSAATANPKPAEPAKPAEALKQLDKAQAGVKPVKSVD